MDVNYEISKEADIEFHRAICYFKLYNKEESFIDDLLNQLRVICSMPKAFQLRYKNVRIVNRVATLIIILKISRKCTKYYINFSPFLKFFKSRT